MKYKLTADFIGQMEDHADHSHGLIKLHKGQEVDGTTHCIRSRNVVLTVSIPKCLLEPISKKNPKKKKKRKRPSMGDAALLSAIFSYNGA
tara:strand:+ start:286 stop:555 length:270 start_codon:yes stop_codon:yes gene_type:complete